MKPIQLCIRYGNQLIDKRLEILFEKVLLHMHKMNGRH